MTSDGLDIPAWAGSMKKKSIPRRSVSKRASSRSEGQPKRGIASSGESIDPMLIPDERESDEASRSEPRPAPAPGVPVSNEQYEWLKRKAKVVRKPPSKHRQEDPSGKRQR